MDILTGKTGDVVFTVIDSNVFELLSSCDLLLNFLSSISNLTQLTFIQWRNKEKKIWFVGSELALTHKIIFRPFFNTGRFKVYCTVVVYIFAFIFNTSCIGIQSFLRNCIPAPRLFPHCVYRLSCSGFIFLKSGVFTDYQIFLFFFWL